MRKLRAFWQIIINKAWKAKKSKKHSLKHMAESERDTECHLGKPTWRQRWLSEAYFPSFRSFIVVAPMPLVFLVLSQSSILVRWLNLGAYIPWQALPLHAGLESYSDLIAIHAGIGIIIFALVIFIAESLRDSAEKDKARVLLKESFLFPLAVGEILTFFTFIWGDPNFWSVIPVLIIALLTILSLSKLVQVLIDNHEFNAKRAELLMQRMRKTFGMAILERLGDNLLQTELNRPTMKLKYNPFQGKDSPGYEEFYPSRLGTISDIDIRILGKISDFVDDLAIRNGLSYTGNLRPLNDPSIYEDSTPQESTLNEIKPNSNRFIVKKFHDNVTVDSRAVIRIDRTILKGVNNIEVLKSLVKSAFTVEPTSNFASKMRDEISSVRDQLLNAIAGRRLGTIKELSNLYLNLGDSALELLTQCEGGASADAARVERHSLYGGWEQVKWLSTDLLEFSRAAVRSGDPDILMDVLYLPIAIAIKAIQKNDHYIFQEFVDLARYNYALAVSEKDLRIRNVLVDRSWRYLKEMTLFYLEGRLLEPDLEQFRADSTKEFAKFVFFVFQDLLKQAFDARDLDSFRLFLKAACEIFEDDDLAPSAIPRELLLQTGKSNSMPEVQVWLAPSSSADLREMTSDEITINRFQMFFGLTSWIFDQYSENPTDANLRDFYNEIQGHMPIRIEDFTGVFLLSHNYDIESLWGWDRWEMRNESGFTSIKILEKLEKFYVVKSLSYLETESESSIGRITLPYDREFALLARGSRDLMKVIEDIRTNPDRWRFVLSQEKLNSVTLLIALLERAARMQDSDELQVKRSKELSPVKVKEFKEGFLKGFRETSTIRSIFKWGERYSENSSIQNFTDDKRFGVNTVEDKGPFIEEPSVMFLEWGRDYGRNFAISEDAYLVRLMIPFCTTRATEDAGLDELLSTISGLEDYLLLGVNFDFSYELHSDAKFIAKWQLENRKLEMDEMEGIYQLRGVSLPVFEIHNRNLEKQILILRKSNLGWLRQFSPCNQGDDVSLVEDVFYMSIVSFSSNSQLMESFLDNPPEWLVAGRSTDEQRSYLETKVLVKLFERFEFDAKDFLGYRFSIGV